MARVRAGQVRRRMFLTGGSGFLGRHVIDAALQAGWDVLALSRRAQEPLPSVQWLHRSMSEVVPTDLEGCDACLHLAAAGVITDSDNWESCFEANVRQSLAVWRAAIASGISRFVVGGSCFEYGRSGERYEAIPVTAPLEPVTAYGASKAAATLAAIGLAADLKLSLTVLRPFHLFGEGEPAGRFWPSLRAAALSGSDFPMTAGEQVRDFTPVEFAARQFVAEFDRMPPTGQPIIRNVGTGWARSLEAFAREAWTHWQAKGQLRIGAVPMRANEVLRYVPLIE